jgi:hypothetical protein
MSDTIAVDLDTATGSTLVRVGGDTLRFELMPVVGRLVDSIPMNRAIPADQMQMEGLPGGRTARLILDNLGGARNGDAIVIRHWSGTLLLGRRER